MAEDSVPVAEAAAAVDVDAAAHAQPACGLLDLACGLLDLACGLLDLAGLRLLLTLRFSFQPISRGRLVDALLQLAARDLVVVRRDVAGVHRVHAQQVDDVDAELLRGEVPRLLHRPVRGRVAEAAERAGRHQVRIDQRGISAHGGVLVERVVAHAGRAEDRLRLAGVGAVVRPHLDFLRHDAAVLAEAEPHPVAHRHARVAREEFLLAGVDQLDRAAGLAAREGRRRRRRCRRRTCRRSRRRPRSGSRAPGISGRPSAMA